MNKRRNEPSTSSDKEPMTEVHTQNTRDKHRKRKQSRGQSPWLSVTPAGQSGTRASAGAVPGTPGASEGGRPRGVAEGRPLHSDVQPPAPRRAGPPRAAGGTRQGAERPRGAGSKRP